jgi:pilus assembly protein CpaF
MSLLQSKLKQVENRYQVEKEKENVGSVSPSKLSVWRMLKEQALQNTVNNTDVDIEHYTEAELTTLFAKEVEAVLEKLLGQENVILTRGEFHRLAGEVLSEITGYGPITPLLSDPAINEIMVNGCDQIYVEREGKLELTDISFRDDNHLMHIIERIVAPLGKRIDESSPKVDARLPDGSRVNAIIPPISLNGPVLTIRKFSATPYSINDLIHFGTLNTNMASFLKAAVKGRLNIIVGGGTASGKTTTLNVLSSFIPHNERIVTIEDAAELKLQQRHVVRTESRPPNIEGKGQITIRDLVINSLRMRPDRIVVGEVRGGEALDMLQAMNTGHDGSLTTGHANSPRDLLARLETMVLMAGVELPLKAVREQISSALDLLVYQNRFKDGTRRITKITEVQKMEGDIITLQDIFIFEEKGLDEHGKTLGNFRSTGVIPKCLSTLEERGIHLPISIFS